MWCKSNLGKGICLVVTSLTALKVSKGKKHAVTQALKSELEDGEEEYGIRQQIEVLLSAGKYCEAMQCLEGANQGDSQGTRYSGLLSLPVYRYIGLAFSLYFAWNSEMHAR